MSKNNTKTAAETGFKFGKLNAAELNNAAILTKEEAAELLHCTPRYIERQIKAARLRACKPTGKFVRIFRKDLDAFLENCASIAA